MPYSLMDQYQRNRGTGTGQVGQALATGMISAGTGTQTYRPGESENSYIARNGWGQQTGYGAVNIANPAVALGEAINGRAAYSRARGKYEAEQEKARINWRQNAYTNQQRDIQNNNLADDQKRTDNLTALDSAFHSGNRAQAQDQAYQSVFDNAQAGLKYQYDQGRQASGLQMASRGKLGSSTDAEAQAGLANQLNSGTVEAQNSAEQLRQALRASDTSQYQNLQRSILAGDPNQAQQYQDMAQGQSDLARSLYDQAANSQYLRTLGQQQQNTNSALVGGVANAGATGVYGYYGVQNPYGSNGGGYRGY